MITTTSEMHEPTAPPSPCPNGRPADRSPRAARCAAIVAGSSALLLALALFARSPDRVESWYAARWSPVAGRALSAATSLVPASVGEVAVVASLGAILFFGGRALAQVVRGRRRLRNALACGACRGLEVGAVALVFFYAVWGLNYSRPDLARRLQIDRLSLVPAPGTDEARDELVRLCEEAVDAANRAYEAACGSPDAGQPSAPAGGVEAIDRALEQAYVRVAERLGLGPAFGAARGPAKPVLASVAMSYAGISGIYFPFTGEANYNRDVPWCTRPEVIAHEKAHQRGVASEDEANFVGFLACLASDDPYARYAGYLFAAGQLVSQLSRADPEAAGRIRARRAPGVARDLLDREAFWDRYRGVVEQIGRRVNDTYLRAQGDERGVGAYAFSARLIVLFARSRGGTLDRDRLGLGAKWPHDPTR